MEQVDRMPGEMTADEQMELWVAGEPVHNNNCWYSVVDENDKVLRREKAEGGECCPDFSCCKPQLLWPEDVRKSFKAADSATRTQMMFSALGAAMSLMGKELEEEGKAVPKVYIAGTADSQEDNIH